LKESFQGHQLLVLKSKKRPPILVEVLLSLALPLLGGSLAGAPLRFSIKSKRLSPIREESLFLFTWPWLGWNLAGAPFSSLKARKAFSLSG
jgi:hypothetical protein